MSKWIVRLGVIPRRYNGRKVSAPPGMKLTLGSNPRRRR
jgi:hypothetical protein